MITLRQLQAALNAAHFGPVTVDGVMGNQTKTALKRFQRSKGLTPDGIPGVNTQRALGIGRDVDPPYVPSSGAKNNWPRQADVPDFFGPMGGPQCTRGKVKPKHHLLYGNQPVRTISCHEKVASSMQRIMDETIEHYGEEEWRKLGLDRYSGCFNVRAMRGGSRPSMHSWGIAFDFDAARNSLHETHKTARFARPEYLPWWEIVESEGFISLGRERDFDWMHLQAARL